MKMYYLRAVRNINADGSEVSIREENFECQDTKQALKEFKKELAAAADDYIITDVKCLGESD